jgi:hypothetical protein
VVRPVFFCRAALRRTMLPISHAERGDAVIDQ